MEITTRFFTRFKTQNSRKLLVFQALRLIVALVPENTAFEKCSHQKDSTHFNLSVLAVGEFKELLVRSCGFAGTASHFTNSQTTSY